MDAHAAADCQNSSSVLCGTRSGQERNESGQIVWNWKAPPAKPILDERREPFA
jgi:hypothetical protein